MLWTSKASFKLNYFDTLKNVVQCLQDFHPMKRFHLNNSSTYSSWSFQLNAGLWYVKLTATFRKQFPSLMKLFATKNVRLVSRWLFSYSNCWKSEYLSHRRADLNFPSSKAFPNFGLRSRSAVNVRISLGQRPGQILRSIMRKQNPFICIFIHWTEILDVYRLNGLEYFIFNFFNSFLRDFATAWIQSQEIFNVLRR